MSILKSWPICLPIYFWTPKPLKKQRTPIGLHQGLNQPQDMNNFPSFSLVFFLGWGAGREKKKSPLFNIYWSLEHKNHLTLLHKLLLAPASWIPCPAALCTPGGVSSKAQIICWLLGGYSPTGEQSVLIRMLHLQTPTAQWQQDLPVKWGQDKWCIALIPNSVAQTETRWRGGSQHLL